MDIPTNRGYPLELLACEETQYTLHTLFQILRGHEGFLAALLQRKKGELQMLLARRKDQNYQGRLLRIRRFRRYS